MKLMYQKLHTRLKELENEAIKRPVKFFLVKLGFLLSHLAILLFKNSGEGFNIITNNSEKTLCPYSYVHYKKYQKKARLFSASAAATVIVLSVILSLILNLLFGIILPSQAATYTWTQTNWAGGATANTTGHPAPANWTEYSAKDTNLSAVNAGADLQLAQVASSTTHTTNANFNGTNTNTKVANNSVSLNSSDVYPSGVTVVEGLVMQDCTGQTNCFTSLSAWEAAYGGITTLYGWAGCTTGDLTCKNMIAVAKIDGAWTSADTTAVSIDGWTTDATRYIRVYTYTTAARHDGKWNTNKYRLETGTGAISLYVNANYTVIDGLQIRNTGTASTDKDIENGNGYQEGIIVKNNIVRNGYFGISNTQNGTGGNNTIYNNIVYSTYSTGINSSGYPTNLKIYNNTVYNSNVGLVAYGSGICIVGGTVYVENNIAMGTNIATSSADICGTQQYNISSDTSAAGTGSLTSRTVTTNTNPGAGNWVVFTNLTSGSEDFHLQSSAENDAINAGTSFSSIFNGDIDNGFRSGAWDIGADEYGTTQTLFTGTYESATIDLTSLSNFSTLTWNATVPAQTGANAFRVQLATDVEGDGPWNYVGTDGTSGTYFTTSGTAIPSSLNGYRYVRYKLYLQTADTAYTPSLDDITLNSAQSPYPASATLTSSGYNSTDTANVIGALSWTEDVSLPTGATVTVSLRAATSSANLTSSSWSDFTNATANCSKTTGIVSCSLAAIPAGLKDGTGDQWFQYKVTLASTGVSTPTVSSVTASYVVNSPPSLSSVTASQGSDGIVSVGYDFSDSDNSSATVGLFADIGLTLSDNPLSSTATSLAISSASLLTSSGTILLDNEEITYTGKTSNTLTGATRGANTTTQASHNQNTAVWIKGAAVSGSVGASTATGTGKTASWTIATDLPNIENASAKILVLANDLNLANQVGTAQSSTLTIDTKIPAVSSLVIDASQTPAALTFSVSDLTSLQYKVGLSSGAGAFTSYSTSTAITITATDPSTVYYTFKDAKGNQTTGSQATMETPATFMVQDVSNLKSNATSTYQLFSAWQVVSNPSAGFKQYNVYRSTDNTNYSLLTTQTNRLVNYYLDASAVQNTLYYYKVTSQDNSNNISFYSSALQGKANGTQDSGEGGGGQPTITSVTTASKTTQTATITWTTNTLSDSTVEYEASNSTPASYSSSQGVPSMVTSHSVTLRGLTPNTKYYFKVKSTDPSSLQGSEDNSGAGYSFTTNAGPSISAVTTPNITNTTAQISWNTDTASDTFVIYSTNSNLGSPTTTGTTTLSSSGPPYSHTVNLSSLTGGTTYYFYVQSTDSESNTAQDKNAVSGVIQYYSFKTSQDATAPTLTLTCSTAASPITDTVATITWGTSEASTSQIEYGIVTGTYPSVTTIKQDLDTSHTQTLSGLLDTTTYYYRVRSKDASNNETVSGQCTFTTRERLIPASQTGGGGGGGGFIDRTAPTISAIKVNDIVKDQARITWTTNEKGSSIVRYGESEKYGEDKIDFSSFPAQHIDHEVVAGPLNPATVYHYQVLSQDSFGNLSSSKDDIFKTISGKPASAEATADKEEKKDEALDAITKDIVKKLQEGESLQDVLKQANKTIPGPTIIGEIPRVQITPNEVTITWKTDQPATSLVALSPEQSFAPGDYLFEVGNTQDLTTDHTVTIQNLLPGTVYHYQVRSKGIIGEAAKSRDYTFTTLTEKSQISNPLVKSVSDTQALVTWYTTTLGDSLVIFTPYRNNIPKEDERKSQGTPQFTQNHQVLFSNLVPGTKYKVQIQSKDRFNNLAEETIESFTTGKDLAPPEISLVRIKSAIAAGKVPIVQSIITWKTDELSTGQIFYQEGAGLLDMAKSQKTQKDENLSTNHVVVLTNFAPGRVYRFKVASQDQQANEAASRDYTTLTPQRQQTVIDIIIKNFQDTFGFLKNLK